MNLALQTRPDPGKWTSIALAATVHVALLALLIYGIRWQTRAPEAIEVELVRAAPSQPVVEPPPAQPEPQLKVEPKPAPAKPDIALKQKEKPKPKQEPRPKPEADKAQKKLMLEELKNEAEKIAVRKADQESARVKAAQAAAARSKAIADYIERIRGKIKSNIVLPPDIKGNPEAIFDVVQLPSGEILSVKLKKSSGHVGYDAAVERALLKSSPLPKPDHGDLFNRSLELTFRPRED